MKSFVVAALSGVALFATPVAAQTVGNPAVNGGQVDTCTQCTFVVNQAFSSTGVAVGSFNFFAANPGQIIPLLLQRTGTGAGTTFTVLATGATRTAVAGFNSFGFGATSGINLTTANSYFGFSFPGTGVVSFAYSNAASTFIAPMNYTSPTVGSSFNSDGSAPVFNQYAALNNRAYSINATAVPEPASWALMIGGFGLVGAAMRRRAKARTTVAIA